MCRQYITLALKKGARHFVLNAVWQISLFDHPDPIESVGRAFLQHHQHPRPFRN